MFKEQQLQVAEQRATPSTFPAVLAARFCRSYDASSLAVRARFRLKGGVLPGTPQLSALFIKCLATQVTCVDLGPLGVPSCLSPLSAGAAASVHDGKAALVYGRRGGSKCSSAFACRHQTCSFP